MATICSALRAWLRAGNLAATIVFRTSPVWVTSLLLWACLAYVGQASDLIRSLKGALEKHFLFTMTVASTSLSFAAAVPYLLRRVRPRLSDMTADWPVLAVRHCLPTLIALGACLLPLLPFYDARLNPAGWFTGMFDVVGLPTSLAKLDLMVILSASFAVYMTRFMTGRANEFHLHALGYAAVPALVAILAVFVDVPFPVLIASPAISFVVLDVHRARRRDLYSNEGYPAFAIWVAFTSVCAALLFHWNPGMASRIAGALPVLWCAAAGVLAILVFWSSLPALPRLCLLVVVGWIVWGGSYGSRPVRALPADATLAAVDAGAHARAWLDQLDRAPGAAARPVFLVTSDGGGIRAGYWTALVLGALGDAYPGFSRHVFAISSVSGGSIGAAVFSASVAAGGRGSWAKNAQTMLSADFVAPPVAFLLWRDPWVSMFCQGNLRLPPCDAAPRDRAVVLEETIEEAWNVVTRHPAMREPFLELWRGERRFRVPSLILNSSVNGNAAHRIVSNLIPADTNRHIADRVRLSTAALLSARFPLVSPNGDMRSLGREEEWIDGGYVDNSGAAGAQLVLGPLLEAAQTRGFHPVLLVITNDTDDAAGHPHIADQGTAPPCRVNVNPRVPASAKLLSTPLGTLDGVRQSAAESYRRGLMRRFPGNVIRLGLFRCEGDYEFPLGWTLSPDVRRQINDKLTMLKSSEEFARIGQLLGEAPATPAQ